MPNKITITGNTLELVSFASRPTGKMKNEIELMKKHFPEKYEEYMKALERLKLDDKMNVIDISIDEIDEEMDSGSTFVESIEQITKKKQGQFEVADKIDNQLRSAKRAEKYLIKLIKCNLNKYRNQQFITLTYADELEDRNIALIHFKRFIEKIRRYKGKYSGVKDFKYIAVTEVQPKRLKRTGKAVIHFHMIAFNSPFPNNEKNNPHNPAIEKLWKHGICFAEDVQNDEMAFYLAKYLSKDVVSARDFNSNRYFTSRHLYKPEVYRDCYNRELGEYLSNYDVKHDSYYFSDFMGMIYYRRYDLKTEEIVNIKMNYLT